MINISPHNSNPKIATLLITLNSGAEGASGSLWACTSASCFLHSPRLERVNPETANEILDFHCVFYKPYSRWHSLRPGV